MAIIFLKCRPCVIIVNCLGQVLYLGRAPRTKETLPDICECRVGYPTSTSIPRVDRLSTDTPVLGRHTVNGYLGSFPEICVGTFCEWHDFLGTVAVCGGFM